MKIKLKTTKFQIVLEIIAVILLIGMYTFLILQWNKLPDKIPGHYNLSGEIDRWGNKGELLILPIISTVLYLLLTIIQFFPSIWNVPVVVTEANRDKVYGNIKNLLMLMKIEMLSIFFYIGYNDIKAVALSPGFLPVVLIVIFGTIAFFIIRICKMAKN